MDYRSQRSFGWGMSVVLGRLLILVLCLFSFIGQCESRGTLPPLYDFKKKVERARSSFEDVYYELVKSHFFDDVNNPNTPYSNNLIISTSLNDDPVMQGTILLGLISWLEKKNDRDSRFLLRKINRLYHLEFHRTLSSLNSKNENYKDSLLGSFHELSKYKVFNVAIGADYPFGTTITKAVLTLLVVNKTSVPYAEKKESVLYTLEKIKQEMFAINSNLGKDKVDEEFIRAFIFGLEKFGVRETLVESKFFRNVVIFTILAVVVGFIVYRWDVVGSGLNTIGTRLNELIDKIFDGFFEKAGKGLAKGMLETEEVKDFSGKAAEDAVRGALRAAAHDRAVPVVPAVPPVPGVEPIAPPVAPPAPGPNPDVLIIIEQAIRGVLRAAVPNEPNPNIQDVVGQAVDAAIRRALHAAAHAPIVPVVPAVPGVPGAAPVVPPVVPPAPGVAAPVVAPGPNPDIQIIIGEAVDAAVRRALHAAAHDVQAENQNQQNQDLQIIVQQMFEPIIREVRQGWGGSLLFGAGRNFGRYDPRGWIFGNAPVPPVPVAPGVPGVAPGAEPSQPAAGSSGFWNRFFGGGNQNAENPDDDGNDSD